MQPNWTESCLTASRGGKKDSGVVLWPAHATFVSVFGHPFGSAATRPHLSEESRFHDNTAAGGVLLGVSHGLAWVREKSKECERALFLASLTLPGFGPVEERSRRFR